MFSRPVFKSQLLPPSPPLRFPQKLWKIANECQSGAVCWSPDGKSILLRYSLFKEEFMSMKNNFFKTDNISSFVRQLNLYGFRKVYDHAHKQAYKANPDLHEFSNICFQRDRPDLLDKVARKSGVLKDKNDFWADNRKSTDFLNDPSYDKLWEKTNISVDKIDHTYLCIQKSELLNETLLLKELEENNLGIIQSIHVNKENLSLKFPENITVSDQNAHVPVKKKRGRKPGSKRDPFKISTSTNPKIYYSPVLKNPTSYPNLIYFDDDNDIYLRNTSRDVMLSSTLPFQETPEYLELKEASLRLNNSNVRIRY